MKWFFKYWLLKHEYDVLVIKYNTLCEQLDKDIWKEDPNV